jgi:hypothetical protein
MNGTADQFVDREAQGAGTIRRLLLVLVLFGSIGLALELVLLEHFESVWQWIPLGVLATGLASGILVALRPTHWSIRVFQVVMMLFIVTALLGLYLHYDGNVEFEREMDDSARGIDLFWRSLRGATPALAPGAMAQVGLLGLILAYRHPGLRREISSV